VILLVGAVDAAGHAHGGDSPEYRDAAVIADRAVARVLARVDRPRGHRVRRAGLDARPAAAQVMSCFLRALQAVILGRRIRR